LIFILFAPPKRPFIHFSTAGVGLSPFTVWPPQDKAAEQTSPGSKDLVTAVSAFGYLCLYTGKRFYTGNLIVHTY